MIILKASYGGFHFFLGWILGIGLPKNSIEELYSMYPPMSFRNGNFAELIVAKCF